MLKNTFYNSTTLNLISIASFGFVVLSGFVFADINNPIAQLDINTVTLDDVNDIFDNPVKYLWKNQTYTKDSLPDIYIAHYKNDISILINKGNINEIRFESSAAGYIFQDKIQIGSSLDEVLAAVGQPTKTVTGQSIDKQDNVLYKDINGTPGYCCYWRPDQNVRFFFQNYNVSAIYLLRNRQSILGRWSVVDCVRNIEDFNPDQKTRKKNLILKELHFSSPTQVNWTFKNNIIKETPYTKDTLTTIKGHQAKYSINTIDNQEYLIVEWITSEVIKKGKKPNLYVLKQGSYSDNHVMDISPVGRWTAVDFVWNIKDFKPPQKYWEDDLMLKNLALFRNGTTSGPWTWRGNTIIHPGDRTQGSLAIHKIKGSIYLFMEWVPGKQKDQGEGPYYVLKKK